MIYSNLFDANPSHHSASISPEARRTTFSILTRSLYFDHALFSPLVVKTVWANDLSMSPYCMLCEWRSLRNRQANRIDARP